MTDHTIVVGYGTMGRGAVATLLADGTPPDHIIVVDRDPAAVERANSAGVVGIVADATQTAAWRQARLDRARRSSSRATATTRRRWPRSPPAR